MALFVLGDLHLSFSVEKPMDVFHGWENYVDRIENNWKKLVRPEDTVVLAGDLSWGMSLAQSLADFRFLHQLPGRKLLLKGNHDYWWTTAKKMEIFFEENGLDTLKLLHNNAYRVGDTTVCGTRGWVPEDTAEDEKMRRREAARLELSLSEGEKLGGQIAVFLHYPPIWERGVCTELLEVLKKYGVKRCFYGHLHGPAKSWAIKGETEGIFFSLISCDAVGFMPVLVD